MDYTYILVLIGAAISAIASWNVNRTFKKYSSHNNGQGMTSQDVANIILQNAGIDDVKIERISRFAYRPLFTYRKGTKTFRFSIWFNISSGNWRSCT